MRRYAEDTAVPISRSRSEIDRLLREWGATGIQWTDEFERDRVTLRFIWPRGEQRFQARFMICLRTRAELEPDAIDRRTRRVSKVKMDRLLADRGKREHRVLALWLKAALNAVDSGLVDAKTLFLPWLEGNDGRTVAELAVPHLGMLLTGSASRLLLSAPATRSPRSGEETIRE
jgi:hypothetical protein